MSPVVFYEAEESVRVKCACFLLALPILWFALFAFESIVARAPCSLETGKPWAVPFTITTIVMGLVGCLCVVGLIRGGTWYLQVNDEAVLWHGPLVGKRSIRHADVEWFEYPVGLGEGSPSTRIRLRSGETIYLPNIGDQFAVHQLLLKKWKLLEERST